MGVTSLVSEILLLSKTAKFPFLTMYQYVSIHINTFKYVSIRIKTYQYVSILFNTYQYVTLRINTCISETEEVTPTKIGVHVCYITIYKHDFFSEFRSIKFFDDHGVRKGNLAVIESSNISETDRSYPPKLVCMYVTSTSSCMIFLS